MTRLAGFAGALLLLAVPATGGGHPLDQSSARLSIPWSFEPWGLALLAGSLALYALGVARLWRHAGRGRGVRPAHVSAFLAGWLSLGVALVSPLDALGGLLFSAHMLQHELMMVMAAPLLIIGRPLAVWAWALPPGPRKAMAPWLKRRPVAGTWHLLTEPLVAWTAHGLVLWGWHLPALFEAALRHGGVHVLQHTSFLLSALLFWWGPLGNTPRSRHGPAMFYLFSTMLHTGALGALLTFSPTLWYPTYGDGAARFGFDPVEDQQIGGLVMWVPGGLAYLAAGLALAGKALRCGTAYSADKISI